MTHLSTTIAAMTLILGVASAPSGANAQDLYTFGVLGASTVTNTGPTVINGNLGLSPGSSITGFPPGIVAAPYDTYTTDAVAAAAQGELTTLYNTLAGIPSTADLSGQDLAGMVLTSGTYFFNSEANLNGTLTLDFQNNPDAVFIFNIGSTLITGSASTVQTINPGDPQLGSNVFWRVGSSATLGTTTTFMGHILAQESITLTTGATINCGAAWARTGAVTLDTNVITVCDNALTATEILAVVAELSGETGTGVGPTGTQAMDSFLSLLGSRFADGVGPEDDRLPGDDDVIRALGYGEEQQPVGSTAFASFDNATPSPRQWSAWVAGYGSHNNTAGDGLITHDRSSDALGVAFGIDSRLTPDTRAGIAVGTGGTSFSLSDGLGNGSSSMVQLGIHGRTNFDAAYVAGALAYAWHGVTTVRSITMGGGDTFTANFTAHNVAGQIEGGYRFGVFVPYAALRAQSFYTPAYAETSASGDLDLALGYEENKSTALRSEVGARINPSFALDDGATLTLQAGAAWAHNYGSTPIHTAAFQTMPVGPSFTVSGAAQPRDSLVVTAGARIMFKGGLSVAGVFDGEFAEGYQTYAGTGRLRYSW